MSDEVILDGSEGEGGGQILRSALSLSVLTGRPFRIHSIRAGRDKPGLRPQHLTAVRALAAVSDARVEGARAGSSTLSFRPGPVRAGDWRFDVGTAGAVSLIWQALVLPLARAAGPSRLTLTGGTHVAWSPPVDYVQAQWLPLAGRMGLRASLLLERAGYYPAGGGMLTGEVAGDPAWRPASLALESRGPLAEVALRVVISGLPPDIARRMQERAQGRLRTVLGDRGFRALVRETVETPGANGPGVMFMLHAGFGGATFCAAALGAKGRRSEDVADEACDAFAAFLDTDATVDVHAADQLLLPCALAAGRSVYRTPEVTQHLVTNAAVIRRFLDVPIAIEGAVGESGRVVVGGPDQGPQ